jgi:hypothetical protein
LSGPDQWLLALEGFGYDKDIDALWVHVNMHRSSNLRNHGTSFWISAEWGKHFAQVGVGEHWISGEGAARFGGWKGFWATTFDISDPAKRMTVKVHTFPEEALSFGDGATFRIGKDGDSWSMNFIPDNRQFNPQNVHLVPIQADKLDRASLVLESFDQMESSSWNLSTYFSRIPICRMTERGGAKAWPHSRVSYEGSKRPPEYLGLHIGRHWYNILGLGEPSYLEMGHIGSQPHPLDDLW